VLSHRGPDGEGFHFDAGTGLGHRRLSVIDVAGGAQPLSNEDGTVWISFNGEIYNFPELKDTLVRAGHRFRTATDTEVIVHLYEEHGLDAVGMLNGMFAFGLWDSANKRLVLARDRAGIKPLYYADGPDGLYFSSELGALAAGMEARPAVNMEAVCRYLLLQYVPEPDTIFEGFRKLPPGHTMVVGPEGRSISGFTGPAPSGGLESSDAPLSPAEVLRLLRDSVQRQLISDVPLGAFLSGGLDSSAVVALMREFCEGPVKTFSIGFEGPAAFDERPYARRVAGLLGTDHRETSLAPAEFAELMPIVAGAMDEPVADPAAVPTYKLSRLAREHVTVVMTGEGGDELFGGYLRYRLEAGIGGSASVRAATGLLSSMPGLSRRSMKALRALSSKDWAEAHLNWVSVLLKEELEGLIPGCGGSRAGAAAYFAGIVPDGGRDRVGSMMRCDMATWLPDDLLAKVDRMSMTVSLEARVPYLDNSLLETVAWRHGREKMRGTDGKRLLREAMRGVLPGSVIDRKKRGFDLPLGVWFREGLGGFVSDAVQRGPLAERFGLDAAYMKRMVSEHVRGKRDWALPLFSLVMLSLWAEGRGV